MTNLKAVHQTGSIKHLNTIFQMLVPVEGRTKADDRLVQKEVEIDFLLDIIPAGETKGLKRGIKNIFRRMSNTSVNSSTDPDSDCHMHQRQMLRGMLHTVCFEITSIIYFSVAKMESCGTFYPNPTSICTRKL